MLTTASSSVNKFSPPRFVGRVAATLLLLALPFAAPASAEEPIKIGFGMSLTGPLAANGKMSLVAMQVWEDDINAKGGLLGRPVKLVYYDDQSNPAQVPSIYSKLLDVDKVDLIVSGYASTQIAAAMPIAIEQQEAVRQPVRHRRQRQVQLSEILLDDPERADAEAGLHARLLQGRRRAEAQAADHRLGLCGRRVRTQRLRGRARERQGVRLQDRLRQELSAVDRRFLADRARDPGHAIRISLVICSYPLDTVGMIKAMHEVGFKPKMWGGAMVGLQATVFKTQLGPLLNGVVNYETWLPVKSMALPGLAWSCSRNIRSAPSAAGTDPLGYYMPVWAYADLQVLGEAIAATKSLNDDVLADYMHKTTFKTVVGDVKFGPPGEWAEERTLAAQFQNIKGNSIDDFRDLKTEVIVYPPQYKSGEVIYPTKSDHEIDRTTAPQEAGGFSRRQVESSPSRPSLPMTKRIEDGAFAFVAYPRTGSPICSQCRMTLWCGKARYGGSPRRANPATRVASVSRRQNRATTSKARARCFPAGCS